MLVTEEPEAKRDGLAQAHQALNSNILMVSEHPKQRAVVGEQGTGSQSGLATCSLYNLLLHHAESDLITF